MNLVSFIIVNWNGKHLLSDCLNSIKNQTYSNYEIILVDNGSIDDSPNFVKEHFPDVNLIQLEENKGFTGGNIEGLKQARGNFIALLNNDAIIHPRWLEHMLRAINSNERIGICSSKIIIDGTNKIDSIGDTFTTAFNGTKVGEYQEESNFISSRYFPGACAAAVLYRKQMIDEIGFLDDDFFLNHEDTDFNMRSWLAGWKCIFVPEAIAYHKVSVSIGHLSDKAIYYFSRNTEWVWIKNVPLRLIIRYLPHRLLYECASFGFFCIVKNKWRPFLKGKIDAIKKINLMIKKRKSVQKLIKLPNDQIKKELIPISRYIVDRLRNLNVKI